VVIVGAGPYGLSLGAHLSASGVAYRIFGTPMAFWSKIATAAPERFLKSFAFGTDISAPVAGAGFSEWCLDRGYEAFEPCAMAHFAEYGMWFQRKFVANLETCRVNHICREANGFQIGLSNGETLVCDCVVIATGLEYFERIPEVFSELPLRLVRHSNSIEDYQTFSGLEVAVVGAGQSALEAAALVREAGGTPTLIVRETAISWMSRVPKRRRLWQRLRYPLSGLGAGPKAWVLTNFPSVCRLLSERVRIDFVRKHLPPEGAWWLRGRVEHVVPTLLNTQVIHASLDGDQVQLRLVDSTMAQSNRSFHHVIAATGFQVDVDRIALFDDDLKRRLVRLNGAPKLDGNFRSSIPGLFFVGPAASMSFGPLFRFVVGAKFTASKLSKHLRKTI